MQQKRNEDANRVRVRSQGDWNAVDKDGNENAASRALQRKGHQLVGFTRVRGESRKEFDAYDIMIVGEEQYMREPENNSSIQYRRERYENCIDRLLVENVTLNM